MSYSPTKQLDLECSLATLTGGLKGLSALLGSARTLDVTPCELAAMIDLLAEQAQKTQMLAGFQT